jgi:hypothetical protein
MRPFQKFSLLRSVGGTGGGGPVPYSGVLLLEGDEQSGADVLLLEGDEQSGADALELEGNE